ncbi:hypothetical protein KGY77_09215 [Candidatus Bipolaricaulota bacterium]|nr:hypothetical protein [Candidatus Bipolaricaulota bacterium]MBS3792808.1 hypothetical protein [Candidatus Bipolaricaulota bacterium]
MKKLTHLLVAILVSSLLIGGLASAQEAEMKTYSNEEYGFSVSYPEGWTKTEMSYKGSAVLSVSAYPDPHNVSITASRLKKDLSLEEYVRAYDLRLDSLVRYQDVEKGEETVSGVDAVIRVSTMARSGDGGTRGMDVYLKKGDLLYTLSFTTSLDSYEEAAEEYFDPVLNSFELTE